MDQELYDIIARAKRGGTDAFTQLMKLYKGRVYQQAYALLNDAEEAKDIAQEAFIKAYRSIGKLESEYAFASWLTRIVSNLCYDRSQKQKQQRLAFTRQQHEQPQTTGTQEAMQMKLHVHDALQQISFEQREAFLLRELYGFAYEEIATILSIPVGTVKSRIHAARMALREELSK